MKKFIYSFDTYGHDMSLNFNKRGHAHNTLIGGCINIIIPIIILIYTVYLSIQVFGHEKDYLNTLKVP